MDDLISRQAAIDALISLFGFNAEGEYGGALIETLNGLPTIEAEPKLGRWIKNEAESALHVESIYDCSACHNWQAWGNYECTPYCPNCGAKMEVKHE